MSAQNFDFVLGFAQNLRTNSAPKFGQSNDNFATRKTLFDDQKFRMNNCSPPLTLPRRRW